MKETLAFQSPSFFFLYQQILPYLCIDLWLQRPCIFHRKEATLDSVDQFFRYTVIGETLRLFD